MQFRMFFTFTIIICVGYCSEINNQHKNKIQIKKKTEFPNETWNMENGRRLRDEENCYMFCSMIDAKHQYNRRSRNSLRPMAVLMHRLHYVVGSQKPNDWNEMSKRKKMESTKPKMKISKKLWLFHVENENVYYPG